MVIPEGVCWRTIQSRLCRAAPEAFTANGDPKNHIAGTFSSSSGGHRLKSPVDGTVLGALPMLEGRDGEAAVTRAAREAEPFARVDLSERKRRVAECVASLRTVRELLIATLVWEIGKTRSQAASDVDRCLEGVDWYVQQIEDMVAGREPLGLVANVASWNYPLSVLLHSMLVQALAGNAVIAKTPSKGGAFALTLCVAIARRHDLPLSLVSGAGGALGEVLVAHQKVNAVAFVGGRSSGRRVEQLLIGTRKRYMLEMEGVNAYGVWEYSDWHALGAQLKKGFEYAKQRCTAYVRFVVQRRLLSDFLDTYLPIVRGVRVGNPLLTLASGSSASTEPAPVELGPLIGSDKAAELDAWYAEAVKLGALPLYRGKLDDALFVPGQDRSAYFAPATLLNVPRSASLYYREPFGPLDSIVVVDTRDELVAEINASGGALVASIASDDQEFARGVARELRSFKVGINRVRSRGDREEHFGGVGKSWRGCFVGGKHLVRAVTSGPEGDAVHGNFEAEPEVAH